MFEREIGLIDMGKSSYKTFLHFNIKKKKLCKEPL